MKKTLQFAAFLVLSILVFSSCGKSPDKTLDYEGIKFNYPSSWKIGTEKDQDGSVYIDGAEKLDASTIFLVSYSSSAIDPLEIIKNYLTELSDGYTMTNDPVTSGKFGEYPSSFTKYKMTGEGEEAYGEVHAFTINGRTALVIKQSGKESKLSQEKYKVIENSFKIEKSASDSIQ